MFFSASIAFTFVLTLSGIAVHSAPIALRADFVPQACSGPNGTGTCTPLNVASPNTSGPAINPAACTNNCEFGGGVATEHFSDDSSNLPPGIQSVSCEADPGFVNGLLAGFQG
ncbi:hypothetical protein C8F04DRAFT_1148368 [Mycena alexandri]|uniref:Uncharacterized protein n=1 Tax=Mycena alexandri TaxID=1745969 RepID=A0AAD6S1S7_9AGAR|nr:hypothetical protein C8F04DRAFT_1148368 [Mycena alexandri]